MQPAIASLTTALAPLAPIGQAIARVFGIIADAVSGVVGWVGQLLAPVTLTKDEFEGLSASGQSLGAVIGGVLGTAFSALTLPIRTVGALVGWVMGVFETLAAYSPLAAITAAWQPLADFFTSLWAGITTTVGQAIAWIGARIGWVMDAGRQVGGWFGSLFGGEDKPASATDKPALGATVPMTAPVAMPSSPIATKPAIGAMVAMPALTASAVPATPAMATALAAQPMAAQPLAPRGNTSVSLSAPITVNAPPGMDAREIAALIESRLRALMRTVTQDRQRSPAAALYD